jgi:CRP-like cAMP-binding protein
VPTTYRNAVIASLSSEDAARLTANASLVPLEFGKVVHNAGDRVQSVLFPERGLVSLMLDTEDGRRAETGMIGVEGALGLVEACGTGVLVPNSIVQVQGDAWRVPAKTCRQLSDESPAFRRAIFSRLEFQMTEARQSATCRSFHPVEARLARWLLESQDRSLNQGPLSMTHEFIAAMLGVQRSTVSAFAPELQKSGLIRYSRGKLTLLDPVGLETLACECRNVLVAERKRITAS